MTPFADLATVVVLTCTAAVWWASAATPRSRLLPWIVFILVTAAVVVGRLTAGAVPAMELAGAGLVASIAIVVGRDLLVRRVWPARAGVIAVAAVTAAGATLRTDRVDWLIAIGEPLQPDVQYYHQQASATANPFAAGWKSPLWPALHAPLLRAGVSPAIAMRVLSWVFGVLMLPAVALAMGRLLDPVVGVVTAAMLAADPWLVDLCGQGLREELGLTLWMVVLLLLFNTERASWRRAVAAGVTGGVLLLLRNIAVVPLMAVTLWAALTRRWSTGRAAIAGVLPLMLVSPFYVNQYRAWGDPFAMEKRDARYHANGEFGGGPAPGGLSMPTPAERAADPYAGEPISPLAYLVHGRRPADVVRNQIRGLSLIVAGRPFHFQAGEWMRLVCAISLLATLLVPGKRWALVFVLASLVGIRAHLYVINQLDQRLLLPVMVIWLATGWWLIASAVRVGGRRWLALRGTTGRGPRPGPAPHAREP